MGVGYFVIYRGVSILKNSLPGKTESLMILAFYILQGKPSIVVCLTPEVNYYTLV